MQRHTLAVASRQVCIDEGLPLIQGLMSIRPEEGCHYRIHLAPPHDGESPLLPEAGGRAENISSYLLAGVPTTLQIIKEADRTLIAMDGVGTFASQPQLRTATCLHRTTDATPDSLLEIVLGPLLTTLLAEDDIYCLHASAIQTPRGLVCFVGNSGAGKSTLAAFLSSNGQGWTRAADDMLPVSADAQGRLTGYRDFPQLKLVPPIVEDTTPAPVAAIIELRSDNALPAGSVTLEPMTPAQGALLILSHTVGSRLLVERQARRHFGFATAAGLETPTYRLHYAHRRNHLPVVAEVLQSEIG